PQGIPPRTSIPEFRRPTPFITLRDSSITKHLQTHTSTFPLNTQARHQLKNRESTSHIPNPKKNGEK
ncbi:MAG: hypothetical protein QXL24_06980, partial [Candidatus Jordarchaeaceae archaeon]